MENDNLIEKDRTAGRGANGEKAKASGNGINAELAKKYSHIKGWGVDANPEDHPNYPMKNYTGDDHKRINWERPPLQDVNIEVLHSNERPSVSAVFGATLPPKGLSGMLRRFAFKYSENQYRHWLPLLLADRVNAIEGVFEDLARGHIPNIFAERGWGVEWKYDKPRLIKRIVVRAVILTAIGIVLYRMLSKDR